MSSPPPADVLAAFGVEGRPQPLAGGRRTVWRVGSLVLKRLDRDPAALAWEARVLTAVGSGVRVAPPVPARSGAWVVDGWIATPWCAGRPAGRDWPAIMAAGLALHRALRAEPRPPFLDDRDDVWARADRLAWDLAATPPHPRLAAAFAARRPVDLPNQLVHGDLTGNVLLDASLPPAVLDFSPYWRPPQWATAVVCADAMLDAGAQPQVVLHAAQVVHGAALPGQVLLRAVLFRLVTTVLLGGDPLVDPRHAEVLERLV